MYNNRGPTLWREYAVVMAYLLRKDAQARNWFAARIEAGIDRMDALDNRAARADCTRERAGGAPSTDSARQGALNHLQVDRAADGRCDDSLV
jgi:hypothetical protein